MASTREMVASLTPRASAICAIVWPLAYRSAISFDRQAGYRYDLSILQAEFSLTQVLDRPAYGRMFFEHVIRENLDLGRPEEVSR